MAYRTGVALTMQAFIDELKAFCVTQGFTAGPQWVSGANTITYVEKGGIFYHITWYATGMYLTTNTGSAGAGLPSASPGHLHYCYCEPLVPPFVSHHFFSQGKRIHTVVEVGTNSFMHFSFGEIDKVGNWEGGQYVSANHNTGSRTSGNLYDWSTQYHQRVFDGSLQGGLTRTSYPHMRVGTDVAPTGGAHMGGQSYMPNSTTWARAMFSAWDIALQGLYCSPNAFNGRAALFPLQVYLGAGVGSSPPGWRQVGHVPEVAAVRITNINPKEIVNTDWMVFPVFQKNGDSQVYVDSGTYGLAYKL